MGIKTIYYEEGEVGKDAIVHSSKEIKVIEYSTGILILPLFFLAIFILYLFHKELEPYSIRSLFALFKEKIRR